jgi:nitrogen regulatory protein PII
MIEGVDVEELRRALVEHGFTEAAAAEVEGSEEQKGAVAA